VFKIASGSVFSIPLLNKEIVITLIANSFVLFFYCKEPLHQQSFHVHLERTPKNQHCGMLTNVQTVKPRATALEAKPSLTSVHQATTVHKTRNSPNSSPAQIARTTLTMANTSKPNARIALWDISVKRVLSSRMNVPSGRTCHTV